MKFSKGFRKNFVIFSLVIMLGLIGYINYNLNKHSFLQTSSELEEYRMNMLEESGVLTDLLEEESIVLNEEETKNVTYEEDINMENSHEDNEVMNEIKFEDALIVDSREYNEVNELLEETTSHIKESITSKEAMKSNAYFIESKLERDKKRSEMIGHLNDIIDNQLTSEEIRNQALDLKMNMITSTEKETLIENMIVAKGFSDVIVYLSDHSINIVVSSEKLEEEDVVKIVDIVKRETDIPMDGITIMNKK